MTPALHELEPRDCPASPFPDAPTVPVALWNVAGGSQIAGALDGGGPRLKCTDAAGGVLWDVFIADPSTRAGVNPDAVDLLLSAAGVPVLSTAELPAVPVGVDVGANLVDGSAGGARRCEGLTLADVGPADVGVGILFRSPPASEAEALGRASLPSRVIVLLPGAGYSVYFVAVGPSVSLAQDALRYVEVSGDSLDPAAIAADVLGRLA
jgi:hypothetical protein